MKKENAVLIEDHHQALEAWREKGFKKLPLVHLDAHIDFGFYSAKPFSQAIGEAKSIDDLKKQLETSLLYQKHKKDLESQLNIGNYIYPAQRDGIVSSFYWVIPGAEKEFKRGLRDLRLMIKGLKSRDPHKNADLDVRKESVSTLLYNKCLNTSYLSAIKKIKEPILLDIDVDYLLFDSIQGRDISLVKNVAKRRPWIFPGELGRTLKRKFPNPACITIAYSVNGGFTPLEYKYFGDEIYLRLKGKVEEDLEEVFSLRNAGIKTHSIKMFEKAVKSLNACKDFDKIFKARFLAHLYFWLFKLYWGPNREEARFYYQKTLKEDPTYRARDNNLGPIYLRRGDLECAAAEFEKIIYCDPEDIFSLCGMGEVLSRRKRYRQALDKFKQGLKLKPEDKPGLLGAANCQIRLDRLSLAQKTLLRLKKLDPFNTQGILLTARLKKKMGQYASALAYYKEAVMLGQGQIDLYWEAFDILKSRENDPLFLFFKQKYGTLKDNYLNKQRIILIKQKKNSQVRKLDMGFRKVDRILRGFQMVPKRREYISPCSQL